MNQEHTSLQQDIRQSIKTNSIVLVDADGCSITDIMAQLSAMGGVTECDKFSETANDHDVWGVKDGDEFRLRVVCNS